MMKKQKKKGNGHYAKMNYQVLLHDPDRITRQKQNICTCGQRKMICHTRNKHGRRR